MQTTLSLTDDEELFVKRWAERYGYSIAAYLRQLIRAEMIRPKAERATGIHGNLKSSTASKDPYDFEQDVMEAESRVNMYKEDHDDTQD